MAVGFGSGATVKRDEDIINWIKENDVDGYSVAEDPAVRDRLAELWIEAQVCRLMTMRSMSLVEQGGNFTYEGAAEKVWAPEHGVRTTETIAQILGPYAQLLNGSEDAIEDGLFAHNLMGAFQSGINHGSAIRFVMAPSQSMPWSAPAGQGTWFPKSGADVGAVPPDDRTQRYTR